MLAETALPLIAKFIIHGRSPIKSAILKEVSALRKLYNFEIQTAVTAFAGHAEQIVLGASASDLIISCGGDGTNNQVVNGLMAYPISKRPQFSYIPAGSGNDFARANPARKLHEILDRFNNQNASSIDLYVVQFKNDKRFGLNLCTCGIGAEIAKTVNRRKFTLPPTLNYYSAILTWLIRFKPPSLSLKSTENEIASKCLMIACGKGKYAGNGLGLCPQANRESLALTVIGEVSIIDFIKYQTQLKNCEPINDPRLSYQSTDRLKLLVEKGTLPVETDGEYFCSLAAGDELRIERVPNALQLV